MQGDVDSPVYVVTGVESLDTDVTVAVEYLYDGPEGDPATKLIAIIETFTTGFTRTTTFTYTYGA